MYPWKLLSPGVPAWGKRGFWDALDPAGRFGAAPPARPGNCRPASRWRHGGGSPAIADPGTGPSPTPPWLFMELLNSMPAMAILHQFLQWGRGRQVTPVVLVLPLLVSGGPLPQQPALSHCPIPGMPPTI